MKTFLSLIVSFLIFTSCEKDTNVEPRSSQNLIIGIWEFSEGVYDNGISIQTYLRKDELLDKNCLVFDEGDVFKSYDHGWCGTPPLSFFLTEGKYSQDQNLLTFEIDHYYLNGGKREIIELTSDKLVLKEVH